jgi:3-oxoacyl-[acyl-carrier protein] reductase|mmetsp:Transcript_52310/g.87354  ORF Transcript_52310/g.87354 Transcript_52310/m.87354 type:complete len:259 (+) Transcript_52310:36-812(+)|eukprot:CAMPEP_0174304948 /NCGR_PEP_ID=MMETSP0809-20121228/61112_1 /TAXON_ID=73025 ORGANISM="Eutreptiella gymnastica-like, Strain CCMP1594" /NCGR_SAMPLE_ID=MMETSP0809 /ASSEMBLY_ACC=CAM_ASM_000658 /LENGTH=258 /DNA_ID=CAMNT_0015411319 /DNA_START=34 /DNA_END=810 /DNA_ORIENTATION=-
MSLSNRVAVITGASRGVGAEIARQYAKEGASVVVNYFQSEDKAKALVEEINGQAGSVKAAAHYGDVTKAEDMESVVKFAIEKFGKVDVVVCNALVGYQFNPASPGASIETVTWEMMDKQMKGTVQGAINVIKAALPNMKENKFGKIVMIGTNLVYNPVVTYYDYNTSKAALVGLMRSLAAELGPHGIRVNLLAGGLLEVTDASSLTTPEVFGFVANGTPLRKTTTVKDFAASAIFCASDLSNAMTGQSISVDGGLTMP